MSGASKSQKRMVGCIGGISNLVDTLSQAHINSTLVSDHIYFK